MATSKDGAQQQGQLEVPAYLKDEVERILLSEQTIGSRIRELGQQLAEDYADKNPILIGVLTGSFPFLSDLSRAMPCKCEVRFVRAKSYDGTSSTGTVQLSGIENLDLTDRHVVIVEDIVDTGNTLIKIDAALAGRGAASIKYCTFLLKDVERAQNTPMSKVQYIAFNVPNHFVIGYGLDFNQAYRNLPFVGIYKQS